MNYFNQRNIMKDRLLDVCGNFTLNGAQVIVFRHKGGSALLKGICNFCQRLQSKAPEAQIPLTLMPKLKRGGMSWL